MLVLLLCVSVEVKVKTSWCSAVLMGLLYVHISFTVMCQCRSPGEDKLVLGCADGSIVRTC